MRPWVVAFAKHLKQGATEVLRFLGVVTVGNDGFAVAFEHGLNVGIVDGAVLLIRQFAQDEALAEHGIVVVEFHQLIAGRIGCFGQRFFKLNNGAILEAQLVMPARSDSRYGLEVARDTRCGC